MRNPTRFVETALLAALLGCGKSDPPAAHPPPSKNDSPKRIEEKPPKPKSLEERIDELARSDESMKGKYRTRHRLWSDLLPAAKGTKHEASIRALLEEIESAANKDYREAFRPVQEDLRRLPSREAHARLRNWKMPEEFDIDGSRAAEVKKSLETLDELVSLEEAAAGIPALADPEPVLGKYLRSPHLEVRTEAERNLRRLKLAYVLDRFQKKMEGRRAAAVIRIERVRTEIERSDASEKARIAAWEKRLQEATRKRPLALKQFGIDWEQPVQVSKFDGLRVVFSGQGFEFGMSLGETPAAATGQLLLLAADPLVAREQFDAARLAVRCGAFEAARKLLDRALALDSSLRRPRSARPRSSRRGSPAPRFSWISTGSPRRGKNSTPRSRRCPTSRRPGSPAPLSTTTKARSTPPSRRSILRRGWNRRIWRSVAERSGCGT